MADPESCPTRLENSYLKKVQYSTLPFCGVYYQKNLKIPFTRNQMDPSQKMFVFTLTRNQKCYI